MNKAPCDCLNWCGDDPWIATGKAKVCDHAAALMARAKTEREQQQKAARLHSAAQDLLTACVLAEAFMAGFEDDPSQEGVPAALLVIRSAIAKALPEGATTCSNAA